MCSENLLLRGVTEVRNVEARLANVQRKFRESARFIVTVGGLQTPTDDITQRAVLYV